MKYRFGKKIRAVRERKNITLKEVAENAGVSESLVSQIERNKVSPSIDTLLSIADVLEIDPEYLFRDYKKNRKVSIVRASERSSMRHKDVVYHKLSSMHEDSDKHSFEVFMLEVEKGAEKGDMVYGHQGKELGILLEGYGELIYGNKKHKLSEGDSVTFSSEIPHVLKNTGDRTLKAIWVTTPSRSLFSGK
jgi:transcriptional regulator with XRE-family HTH domain